MRGLRLEEADLYGANLEKADLRGAIMEGVDFRFMDVKGAHMDIHQAVAFLRSCGAKVD
ncbi:pentapeptide repeat-containing protein [Paenibacillus enshidis]|uniref:Pentapeptide repeat-containing protein n=1 Tax=Paenibacillus enshidis TaxID=1458439 RepID=A0ABV5APX8_9BACL